MSKYIIDVGEGYIRHGLERTLTIPVRINEHEDHWMDTRIPVTPYTEPDFEQVRKEAYDKGYDDATEEIGYDEQEIAEKAYQRGLNDAWSFAEHLAYVSEDVTNSVYMSMNGGKGLLVAFGMSYEDAKRQYDEYFKKKKEEQIQVGDEVITAFGKAVVTGVGPVHFEYVYADGSHGFDEDKNIKKTGRHFPELVELLRKMKEEES